MTGNDIAWIIFVNSEFELMTIVTIPMRFQCFSFVLSPIFVPVKVNRLTDRSMLLNHSLRVEILEGKILYRMVLNYCRGVYRPRKPRQ